jgi:geranylgeranylglycerol-phosphate geranylgeranyltransferase
MYDKKDNIQMLSNPIQKTHGFLKLIRYKNILPTLLLTTTGGFLQTQSITQLLRSKSFLASSMITVCIMASSMILNDLFDIHVDKINNANRPLVTGEVRPSEATAYAAFLLFCAEYLTRYLPQQMQMVANWAIVNIVLYTPILKRIPLLKNLSCATVVAFSLYFAGKSATHIVATSPLLYVAAHTVFFGSLHNELLLDIRDIEGDAKNNIRTVPGLFGKTAAWSLATIGMIYNVFKISTVLSVQYSPTPFVMAMSPIFYHLYQIRRQNYSSVAIKKAVDFTNVPLLLSLLYFCKISIS